MAYQFTVRRVLNLWKNWYLVTWINQTLTQKKIKHQSLDIRNQEDSSRTKQADQMMYWKNELKNKVYKYILKYKMTLFW